jgi:NADH-quinone oxidoreductase subunit I
MTVTNFKDIKIEQRTLGGKTFSVAVTAHLKRQSILSAIKGLLSGMRLTFDYFSHPSKIVTQQYPENRATLKFPERYRANLRLIYEESGYHRCTACKLCDKACPNGSIKVITRKGPTGKNELDRYIWRQDSCVFCNACVQACPFDALEMGQEFENAVYDRRLLIYNLNRYAGPPASTIMKEADPDARAKMMEPRDRYGGPVPLNGQALPNIVPLKIAAVAIQPPPAASAAASQGGAA